MVLLLLLALAHTFTKYTSIRADSALVGTVTAGARATAREEVAVQPPRDDQAPTPQETETKMEKKMDAATVRFVVLSDTHNQHDRITVPDGDVLLHLGDVAHASAGVVADRGEIGACKKKGE
jgi:hypothetical protein